MEIRQISALPLWPMQCKKGLLLPQRCLFVASRGVGAHKRRLIKNLSVLYYDCGAFMSTFSYFFIFVTGADGALRRGMYEKNSVKLGAAENMASTS